MFLTKRALTLILGIFVLGLANIALTNGTITAITGYVYQNDGITPINAINVWASPTGGADGFGAPTNSLGYYSFSVPAGSYRIGAGGNNGYAVKMYDNKLYWNEADIVTVSEGQTLTGKNFTLDVGGTISGHVYIQGGTTPISQENITISLASSEYGRESYGARTDVNGLYSIVVPYGDWKVRAGGNTAYAPEYYNQKSSRDTADIVTVSAAPNTNINFSLELGGTVSGKITDDSGTPMNNVEIRYKNCGKAAWRNTYSNSAGAYLLQGLPEGIANVKVKPTVTSGYAWPIEKDIYLTLGEIRTNIDFVLKQGFLVSGYARDPSEAGIPNIDVKSNSALYSGRAETDSNGYYEMRLPAGTYGMDIGDDNGQYTTLPKILTIPPVPESVDFTVYTIATGGVKIIGNITNSGPYSVTSEFGVVAFPAGTTINIDSFPLNNGVSFDSVAPAGGDYSLLVPPGQNYDIHFFTFNETVDGIESVTVRGSLFNVAAPSTGQNFDYTSVGGTITGTTNYYGAPVLMAEVFLTDSLGNFAGFADTDQNGTYFFYNVPAGNYIVQATAHEYGKSPEYNVPGVLDGGVESTYIEFVTPVMVTADLDGSGEKNDVIIDFGEDYGIWIYYNNSTWTQLHTISPEFMVAGDLDSDPMDDLIIDFGNPYGIWVYYNNSTWTQLHDLSPESMVTGDLDNNGKDDLIINFGNPYGIWVYYNNSTWTQLHNISAESMTVADMDDDHRMDLIVDFGPQYGIWVYYNNSTWSQLHNISADSIVANDLDTDTREDIVVDFGDPYGVWIYYNNSTWVQLHSISPVSMALGGDDSGLHNIIVDFGYPYGIWIYYYNNSSWVHLHNLSPEFMEAGDMDNNGQGDLIIDFGDPYGIWIYYNNSTWSKLHDLSP